MIAKFLQNTFKFSQEEKCQQAEKQDSGLLPNELAGKILDLEIECESTCTTKQTISELIRLYTNAVEHYEANGCQKYKVYQTRMQNFLSKPTIDNILKGKSGSLAMKKQIMQKSKAQAVANSKEIAIQIIQKTQKGIQNNKQIRDKQIQAQHQTLEQRISRRKSMSNKSTKTDNDDIADLNTLQESPLQQMNAKLILTDIRDRNIKRVFI